MTAVAFPFRKFTTSRISLMVLAGVVAGYGGVARAADKPDIVSIAELPGYVDSGLLTYKGFTSNSTPCYVEVRSVSHEVYGNITVGHERQLENLKVVVGGETLVLTSPQENYPVHFDLLGRSWNTSGTTFSSDAPWKLNVGKKLFGNPMAIINLGSREFRCENMTLSDSPAPVSKNENHPNQICGHTFDECNDALCKSYISDVNGKVFKFLQPQQMGAFPKNHACVDKKLLLDDGSSQPEGFNSPEDLKQEQDYLAAHPTSDSAE